MFSFLRNALSVILLACFTFVLSTDLQGQALPPIRNFSPSDYSSENQNWSIAQSEEGTIYVANNSGLLVYNGSFWQSYPSPNGTITRSVTTVGDRVYTGSYMEFGYWEEDDFGVLRYTSLSEPITTELYEDEEFWKIVVLDDWVVFQSLNRIYLYNEDMKDLKVIESPEIIQKMYHVNDMIFYQKMGKGLYTITGGNEVELATDQIAASEEIVNLFFIDNQYIILTKSLGFYYLADGRLEAFDKSPAWLKDYSLYSGIQLSDGSFALGTIAQGLICFDWNSDHFLQIDQTNILQDNTVLAILEDAQKNVWLALDNGVSYLNRGSQIKVYEDRTGSIGSVYASAIHQGFLYLGTNQGLFYKKINSQDSFEIIEGTEGQVWFLDVIDDELFCGHHKGTLLVNQGQVDIISKVPGTWSIKKLDASKNLLIQGNYEGLCIMEKSDYNWGLRNEIEGFAYSSRSFEVHDRKIFVNHEYRGLFDLTVDDAFQSAISVSLDTLLKGVNSSIARFQGNVIYAYKRGMMKYDALEDQFRKDTALSAIYTEEEYSSGRIVKNQKEDGFWIFTKDKITLIRAGSLDGSPKTLSVPLTSDIRRDNIEFENIINYDGKDQYLIGTSYGYLLIDLDLFEIDDFEINIESVSSAQSKVQLQRDEVRQRLDMNPSLDDKTNNLAFNFSVPAYYPYLDKLYQYQLEGLYEEWSQWSSDPSLVFENVPPGYYQLNVRARIGDKLSSNSISYSFTIKQPWYWSTLMKVLYGIGVILFLFVLHSIYRSYYHEKQGEILKKQKEELELERLQNEKEIIRLKNEQLQKNFSEKSKELAASTMSIARNNEILQEIRDKLVVVDDKKSVKPAIKVIDRGLSNEENWEFFKEAFNNADSQFFKQLKEKHPELSHNDLKLCAYLRLNLSSKEIAPLFNISPRSVEIKRYRLRKKLDLNNDINLTDYILSV